MNINKQLKDTINFEKSSYINITYKKWNHILIKYKEKSAIYVYNTYREKERNISI